MKMILSIVAVVLLIACAEVKSGPYEKIRGSWLYEKADSLGGYSTISNRAKREFERSMKGNMFIFYKNHTYKTVKRTAKGDSLIQEGPFYLNSDGSSMRNGEGEEIRINLTDSVLKVYGPYNSILVWRKIKK